ncbi:MAG: metallophosphoesterase, partial [Candidatus Methanofastidiosia archaeon]
MKKIRLVISDLHADIKAFKCILKVIKDSKFMKDFGDFDEILNLGDVLERGSNPKEVLDV